MSYCNWSNLRFNSGVLREPIEDESRLVLWLPGQRDWRGWRWERISSIPGTILEAGQQLRAVPATCIRVVQRPHAFIRKLGQYFRKPSDNPTWLVPNGGSAEQQGARQTDLLLVWSDNDKVLSDESIIKSCWPNATRIQRLGNNLFLVAGVSVEAAEAAQIRATPFSTVALAGTACKQAQLLLEKARAAGDRRGMATALTDLGAITLENGYAQNALLFLEAALKQAQQLGDPAVEADACYHVGKAARAAGQAARAADYLGQALVSSRRLRDRFAEKLTLEQLGKLFASQGDAVRTIAAYEQAIALAQQLGHGQHEADLLWTLAIHHADAGRREQAVRLAQTALERFAELDHPSVSVLSDHLQRYQQEGSATVLAYSSQPASDFDTASPRITSPSATAAEDVASAMPGVSGPGLLRMAFSAAKSITRFVGSGLKTVPAATQQKRLEACGQCSHHTGVRCKLCGCFTSVKARLPHETCPLGKWPG
jgi:tetratricopeptide (TPR) repeat protein